MRGQLSRLPSCDGTCGSRDEGRGQKEGKLNSRSRALQNRSRSSETSSVRIGVPRTLMPRRSKTPILSSWMPTLSAVWPPKVSRTPSGRSFSRMYATYSAVMGRTASSAGQRGGAVCQARARTVDFGGHLVRGLDGRDVGVDEDRLWRGQSGSDAGTGRCASRARRTDVGLLHGLDGLGACRVRRTRVSGVLRARFSCFCATRASAELS